MPQELHLVPAGLWTDPNPHGSAPEGGLLRAQDVVLRRRGLVEPRPGLVRHTSNEFSASTFVDSMVAYDGEVFAFENENIAFSGGVTRRLSDFTSLTPTLTRKTLGGIGTLERARIGSAQARENLYISGVRIPRKLTDATDAAWLTAGLMEPTNGAGTITAGDDAIPDDGAVSYRWCIVRTDANNLIVRSPPSPRVVVRNAGPGAVDVTLTVPFQPDVQAGDVLEIYRTIAVTPSTGTPDDEHFLALEVELQAGDISAGDITLVDSTAEAELGVSLYTNPSQEGIEQANFHPPICNDIALYRRSLFFGGVHQPPSLELKVLKVAGRETTADAGFQGDADGIGVFTRGGLTITLGSPTITGFASTSGIKPGQLISDGSGAPSVNANFPAGTRVLSVAATTVTADASATLGATPTVQRFHDEISVEYDVSRIYTAHISSIPASNVFQVSDSTTKATRIYDTLEDFVSVVNGDSTTSGAYVIHANVSDDEQVGALIFRAQALTGGFIQTLTVGSSAQQAFSPNSPDPTDGVDGRDNEHPAMLMWSKSDEPEHVPLVNFAFVGSQAHRIMRLIATRDALWIFKQDGIWRLTGEDEASGWRIDPYDLNTHLLYAHTAQELEGIVYAWTDRGVVALTAEGLVPLSDEPIGDELEEAQSKFAVYPGNGGPFAVAVPTTREYILGVTDSTGDEEVEKLFVWSANTQAWVRWQRSPGAGAYNPADDLVYFAEQVTANWGAIKQRRAFDDFDNADQDYAVTVSSVTDAEVTIAGGSGWGPTVGDLLVDSASGRFRVVSVDSATVFDVDRVGVATGAGTAYEAIEGIIKFIAKTGGNPGAKKFYGSGGLVFEGTDRLERFNMSFTSDLSVGPSAFDKVLGYSESSPPQHVRFFVPREHSRVAQLLIQVTIRQAASPWSVAALSLFYHLMSERLQVQ